MRLLLDTHIFLWFISGDARLPVDWCDSIRDAGNAVFLSVVPMWEAIVKHRLGKLPLPHPPEHYLPAQRIRHQIASLPLDEASVCQLATLPSAHRDPFDRLIVLTAIQANRSVQTTGTSYEVPSI
jgi:PIN domain nuclease of toxin-antitoxin system